MKKIKTIKIDLLAELIAFESKIEELSTAMRRKCMMSPGLNTSTYFDRLDLLIEEHKDNMKEVLTGQCTELTFLPRSENKIILHQK